MLLVTQILHANISALFMSRVFFSMEVMDESVISFSLSSTVTLFYGQVRVTRQCHSRGFIYLS